MFSLPDCISDCQRLLRSGYTNKQQNQLSIQFDTKVRESPAIDRPLVTSSRMFDASQTDYSDHNPSAIFYITSASHKND